MYAIRTRYSDNEADVIDLNTYRIEHLKEIELIRFENNHGTSPLGLSVSNNKINYIQPYDMIQFPIESEADEYIRYNNLSYKNKFFINNMYVVLYKVDRTIKVIYYVYYQLGPEKTYLGKPVKGKPSYTPYIQAAQTFDKDDAGKKAALLRKNSKTGKYWTTERVVIG